MKLETKLEQLIPKGDGPFDVIAYELTQDGLPGEGASWSVNTPFRIASSCDRAEAISHLRHRWEVFKVNYLPRARVKNLCDIGYDETCAMLEVDCTAFAEIRKASV